jgi:hypothetical protein
MMTESNPQTPLWLELDPSAYEMPEERSVKGVTFHVFVSPYDLPEAIRGVYDGVRKLFLIQFRYLNDEPADRHHVAPHVVVSLGRTSHRLHGIEVDVDSLRAEQVCLKISEAIDHIPVDGKTKAPKPNYAVTKKVLNDKWRELSGELSAA